MKPLKSNQDQRKLSKQKTFDVSLSSVFHKISKCAEFFNKSSKCK